VFFVPAFQGIAVAFEAVDALAVQVHVRGHVVTPLAIS
jgi:hypothetical protein